MDRGCKKIKSKYPFVTFTWIGQIYEEKYRSVLEDLEKNKLLNYFGFDKNIDKTIEEYDCIIHPSYHEGLANVILESASKGRPCIATNINGCKEAVIDNETGYLFELGNDKDFFSKIEKFILSDFDVKRKLSVNARKFVEKNYNRYDVVQDYMDIINKIFEEIHYEKVI